MSLAAMSGFAAVIVATTTLFAVEATSVQNPTPALADQLRAIVGPTAGALDRFSRTTGGRPDRYLVTFSDPDNLGAQAFGLMNELERDGFDIGASATLRTIVTPHRVSTPAEATAVVHLSVGPDIATWRGLPGAARWPTRIRGADRNERSTRGCEPRSPTSSAAVWALERGTTGRPTRRLHPRPVAAADDQEQAVRNEHPRCSGRRLPRASQRPAVTAHRRCSRRDGRPAAPRRATTHHRCPVEPAGSAPRLWADPGS